MTTTATTAATDAVLARYLRPALATVTIPSVSDVPDAGDRFDVELRNMAREVGDVVDEASAQRLVEALSGDGHQQGRTLIGVLGEDTVDVWLSGAEMAAHVAGGPLPALGPLLHLRQSWIPHAVVELDRVGADIEIVTAQDTEGSEVSVEGATSHITKSNPGGWSQRRFQQRAEEHWQDNAKLVADQLVAEIDRAGIDLVLLSGDTTARGVLEEVLPQRIADMIVTVEGGGTRAHDGAEDHVDSVIDQAVRQEASRRRDAQRQQVLDAIGGGAGVTGRDDVLQALFEHRVDTLVIDLEATADLVAHIGAEPEQVAGDSALLHQLGLDATRVPLVDAALRGAAATGAAIVMLHAPEGSLTDGLGASLRGDGGV